MSALKRTSLIWSYWLLAGFTLWLSGPTLANNNVINQILSEGFNIQRGPTHGMGLFRQNPFNTWRLLITDQSLPPEDRLIAEGTFEEIARFRSVPIAETVREMGVELTAAGLVRHDMFYLVGIVRGLNNYQRLVVASSNELELTTTPVKQIDPFVLNIFFPMHDDLDLSSALNLAQTLADPVRFVGRGEPYACPEKERGANGGQLEKCCEQLKACRQAAIDSLKDQARLLLGATYVSAIGCIAAMVGCGFIAGAIGVVVCGLACAAITTWAISEALDLLLARYQGALLDCQIRFNACMRGEAALPTKNLWTNIPMLYQGASCQRPLLSTESPVS